MAWTACGWRVQIKLEKVEEYSKGGIALVKETVEREQRGTVYGTVTAIGPTSFQFNDREDEPWCTIGDRVMIAQYSGLQYKENDEWYAIVNDQDILQVWHDGE